ncbi:EAL domain-containing protein [Sphaerotilus sp.]|uniref:sensor domain-containing protein n=1 Tax=Sphaerotilus sp. TaxID=2093942 RepID=UPI00286E1BC3|nr:EAL domain-containing protein [Sphaerotilus sp.]
MSDEFPPPPDKVRPRSVGRMLGVIAVFGALCLCLAAWTDLRWRATLIDTSRPTRLIDQIRLQLRTAEVQAERLRRGDGGASVSSIDAELDNAFESAKALQTQIRTLDSSSALSARLVQAADEYARQVDQTRQALHARVSDNPGHPATTLRALHLDIDRTVMDMERLADEMRHERLRQQGLLSMATLVLIALGTLGLMLLQQRHASQRDRTLDTLARREAHLRAFAAAMPDVSFVLDAQGTYLEVYGQADKLAAPAETLIGRRYHEFLTPDAAQRVDAIIRRTLATREVTHTEYNLDLNGEPHWFEARAHALPDADDRVVVISWDISERKHSEERIRTLSRLYSFLSQVNQSIVWTRSPTELFERICAVALSHGHFTMAWILEPESRNTVLAPVTQAGDPALTAPEHRPARLRLDDAAAEDAHPALRTWRSGHLRWDVPAASPTQAVAIPVTCNDTIIAVLVLVRERFDPEDAEEQALFSEISSDMSYALTQFQRREQWREGQDRNRLHAAALESTQDGVIVTDMQRRIVSVNRAFTEITGYSEQEAVEQTTDFLRSNRHGDGFFRDIRDSVLQHGRWQGEVWSVRKDGVYQALWSSIATVSDEQGLPTHLVTVFTDITAKKEVEARLQQLAHVDSLTGLPNRLMVLSRMEHALAAARRQHHKVAVLYIDLDNFKNVNDSLGHNAGDQLLVGVARRLAQRTRREDTLARLGGDEFILLLETLREGEDAAAVAQELLQLLSSPFDVGPSEVYVQASIGISLYPEDGTEVEELLRDADTAMYQAKRAGRGTYRYYTEALTQAAQVRLQLDTRLRRALERQEFELWYQPLYRLSDRRLIGLEALVRLNQPGLPPVGPAEFIPVLEDTGHIVALGEWVTSEACRQGRAWLDEGLEFGRIAVNISAVEMQRGGTVARVQKALDAHGLSAEHLELEITESGLMQQGDHSEAFLHSLRAMGVQLAIDDFGTGYSSLSHLKRFPVGKLKIDRSFIRDLMTDSTDAQLVNAMVAMGRSLGISVLAEGVETEDQMYQLQQIGCDAAQGYFFGRPEPAATARRWLIDATADATTRQPAATRDDYADVWPVI